MFTKRGQITVFVVLGIILIAIFGVGFFLYSLNKPTAEITPLQTEAVILRVEKCLEQTAEEAILATGKRGGYFILPEKATTELRDNVPYYKIGVEEFGVEEYFPSVEKRAEEIGKYIDIMLSFCLDFSIFERQGYNVTIKSSETTVTFSSQELLEIRTTLPITFKKELQIRRLEFFHIKINAKQMEDDFALAQEITKSQQNGAICVTCFADLAKEDSLSVQVLPYYENVYVYEITDNDYLLQDEKYVLRFGVKYSDEETVGEEIVS